VLELRPNCECCNKDLPPHVRRTPAARRPDKSLLFCGIQPIYWKVVTGATLMTDAAVAIMDAAERRIRLGGFNGFSFREIAADVGIKSSSVHYHFPTKENLAAAVIQRYTDEVAELIEQELAKDPDPIRVWTRAFRGTLHSTERMCPCTVLGAASLDLPREVAAEVKRFFQMCLDKLIARGLPSNSAAEVLSTITGAMVVANALGDMTAYDRATRDLIRLRDATASKPADGATREVSPRKAETGGTRRAGSRRRQQKPSRRRTQESRK
jgi:TetR/AcrR family transcriptional regulator, transcriptional repressor for nem operon